MTVAELHEYLERFDGGHNIPVKREVIEKLIAGAAPYRKWLVRRERTDSTLVWAYTKEQAINEADDFGDADTEFETEVDKEPKITLEEFVAQKKRVRPHVAMRDGWEPGENAEWVLVYPGGLKLDDNGEAARPGHRYYLQIERSDKLSDDLAALERTLYEYAVEYGAID